ncbi:Kinesin-like protein kif24 [Mortierella polycephala]|uniref:Kinesin-like protein kif24 n=1 Tax=Mortierella polycephala TaxID=41804 RepID=A0A9P6PN62_9FUNG|nr:Kinesin-like protein kif24 [Mortierella polycephala]
MQDYTTLGVTSMEDRRKLFQLVQTIKAQYAETPEPSPSIAQSTSHSSISHSTIPAADDPMAGFSRSYGAQSMGMNEISKRASDARLSMGRRAGANMVNNLNHSRSMSGSMTMAYQQHEQQRLQQQQQQQQQRQEYDFEMQQQQQYQQYQQQQQQLLQQQQYRQQQRELVQQQQQHQYQPQPTHHQYADGRNFREASEDEEDPIPIHEAKQRGLDAYSIPASGVERKGSLGRCTSSHSGVDMTVKIRVCVRKRPLSSKEIHRGEKDMASASGRQLAVDEPKVRLDMTKFIERHKFVFDEVFDSTSTNEDVYRKTAYPLVQYLFEGGKATCFAYGQTGSGKTYTMLDEKQGLYVLAARDIFVKLRAPENSHLSVYIGFYEIYQGQLHDLLNNRKKLHAREDGNNSVVVTGLKEYEIVNVEGLMQVFEYGNSARSTGRTNANADSSRSHAIMQLVLKDCSTKATVGKLSFIDLAGSERGADRGETDVKTRMEGAEINKSLLALKECIRALDQDKKHTPFRQSKLTQVLKDSFVGNSRTCMVATISPNNSNSEHTLNTLRYADRVKELKAEGGAKGAVQEHEDNVAGYDYMDDTEGELGATSAYDDDDFISSASDNNIADETIDLLDDEEFPLALDQEDMVLHPLATSTYDHELEEPSPSPLSGAFEDGEEINSRRMSHQQQSQRQLLQQQQQQHQQQMLQLQLQQQQLDAEKFREPVPSNDTKPLKPSNSIKGRKPEAFSRLPMPRTAGIQQPRTSSPTSHSPTSSATAATPTPHRMSLNPSASRRNSSNISPPLAPRSGRDSRASPDAISPNGAQESGSNNTMKANGVSSNNTTKSNGVSSNQSPMGLKRPSIPALKQGSGGSAGARPSSAASSIQSSGESHFGLNSPTSPKVSTVAATNGTNGTTNTSTNASSQSPSSTWTFSFAEMQDFVREHRTEMQECGELTKRETKLLKNVMLGMSSATMAQTTGYGGDRESFQRYLGELDEIVDEKLITIIAMSQKLKALRSQM